MSRLISPIFLERKKREKNISFFIFFVFFLIFLLVKLVYAVDTSFDSQKTKKTDKEVSQTQRKTKEEREVKGIKKSNTKQIAVDRHSDEIFRSIRQMMFSDSADIVLPIQTFFFHFLSEKENQGIPPFSHCKVITQPKTPSFFGITSQLNSFTIDATKSRILQETAQFSLPVKTVVDEKEIISYRNCLAYYGAIIGQAIKNLNSTLTSKKQTIPESSFILFSKDALEKAISEITDKQILSLYRSIIENPATCIFEKSLEVIKCSHTLIVLSTTPKLIAQNIEIFGEKFFNLHATYRLSKTWSYNDALELMRGTKKYSRLVEDIILFTEELESQGKTKEATLVKKKALDLMLQGKQATNINQTLNFLNK